MGEVEIRVGTRFLEENRLELPICAEVALRAADLSPLPSQGPATLAGDVLRYDTMRPGWEREVWSLVCGVVLRRYELPDKLDARVELARAFGVELDEHTDVFMRGERELVDAQRR